MQTPKKEANNRGGNLKKKRIKANSKDVFKLLLLLVILTVWSGCAFVVSGVIISIIMLIIFGGEFYNDNILSAIYSIIYYGLAAILAILLPILIEKKWQARHNQRAKIEKSEMRTELGLRGLPTWTDIGLAPVGLAVSFLITAGLTALFSFFPWFNAEESQSLIFGFSTNTLEQILTFISLVIVAPVVEELVFRGWLYGKLREKSSEKFSEVWSIIISSFLTSLVFGIMHGQWNVGITVFAMSIIMCGLREITGTIYAGILVHFLKNALAFLLIYIL